jgi:hypothetical protein
MSWRIAALAALALGVGAPVLGCGEEKMERGLAAPEEQATPIDATEERMTEEQRRQREVMEDEAAEQRDFDGGQEDAGDAD